MPRHTGDTHARQMGKPLTAKQQAILDAARKLQALGPLVAADVCRAVGAKTHKDAYTLTWLEEFRSRGVL